MFDSGLFVLPSAVEVANYFLWRQRDGMRNAVSMVGHAHFSPDQLHGVNRDAVRAMLADQAGVVFDDYPVWARRGQVLSRVAVTNAVTWSGPGADDRVANVEPPLAGHRCSEVLRRSRRVAGQPGPRTPRPRVEHQSDLTTTDRRTRPGAIAAAAVVATVADNPRPIVAPDSRGTRGRLRSHRALPPGRNTMSERQLVSVEQVATVTPIEGADAIDAAGIKGWTVVIGKDEFVPGDQVLYIEVDAALPLHDPRFAFLAARSARTIDVAGEPRHVHVLKTARLRGVYSQGIVFALHDFPEVAQAYGADPDANLDAVLDIVKWEPPLPPDLAIVAPFPSFLRKTAVDRVQNLTPTTWAFIGGDAAAWEAVEKIDGTSLTAWKDTAGVLHAATRNWELDPAVDNDYWRLLAPLAGHLAPGDWIQGEVAGPGTHQNPLALPAARLFIFGIGTSDGTAAGTEPAPVGKWPSWAAELRPGVYAMDLPATIAETISQVESLKSLSAPGRLAEGVVWTQRDGQAVPGLGDRAVFKSLSAKYLLKHGS